MTATTERPAGAPWPLKEACKYLNLSERTMRELIQQQKVRRIPYGPKKVMIPDAEVQRVATEGYE
jgi:excisionase family DNA binding protein